MQRLGIDLSEHNGDFKSSRLDDFEFVMIRTGYGSINKDKQEDKQVYNNAKKCIKAKIPFGFYHYTYALDTKMAEAEADFCLSIVDKISNQGNRPMYPIAFDIEDKKLDKLTIAQRTDICIAFCDKVEKAGYYAVIYASTSYFKSKLDLQRLTRFDKWLADWTKKKDEDLQKIIPHGMRQFKVDKNENLDYNYAYKDYPNIIGKMYGISKELKVGSIVKVIKPIIYGTNKKFKQYYEYYEVLSIGLNRKNRIVIGRNGITTSAIDKKYLEVIK